MAAPAALLTELRAHGVEVTPGAEPGTVQLALRGPLPPALRAAIRDRAGLREALDHEAAAALAVTRGRANAIKVLRHAAHMMGWAVLPPRLVANPSRALYWALGPPATGDDAEQGAMVAELVHDAVRAELAARYPSELVERGLVRLGATEGPGALRELFLAAAERLRPERDAAK
ncbi:MAG: hypothetical protein ACYDHB_00975 [Candidatus Dormibacteria bacterium]